MPQMQALLHGTKHLEPVDLSGIGGPKEVLVRPLSELEVGHLDRIKLGGLKGQRAENGDDVIAVIEDMGDFLERVRKSKVQAVAYGLSHSGETCTVDILEKAHFPAKWTNRLANVIFQITGVSDPDDSFRRLRPLGGGVADAPPQPYGSAASTDAS